MENIHVIAVSSITKREQLISKIYENLIAKNSDASKILILKDRINRISVYHVVSKDNQVLVKTILFVVIPIMMNVEALDNFSGNLFFDLDDLIITLRNIAADLEDRSGRHIIRRDTDAEVRKLVESLPDFYV